MEFLSHPVIAVILLLGVLIFVHEAGHFLVGKAFGIAVDVFSIGFGPVILSFQRKETNYRLSVIPLGGYVKFYGSVRSEDVPDEIRGREFYNAPLRGRILTVLAGPLANFLLAIVIFTGFGMYGMQRPPAVVGQIMPGSPAAKAGLQIQDQIIQINEEDIQTWQDLQRAIEASPGSALDLVVKRDGDTVPLTITPESVEDDQLARTKGRIGIAPYFTPPVITMTEPQGPAAKAGMVTGMRIKQVSAGEQQREIRYWHELETFVDRQLAAGVRQFAVQAYPVDPKAEPSPSESEVAAQPQTYTIQAPKNAQDVAAAWGVTDAQLTIGRFEKPVEVLQPGDHIEAWDGKPVQSALMLNQIMAENKKAQVEIAILRNGERLTPKVDLKPVDVQRAEGKVTLYTLPVRFWGALESPEPVTERYPNPLRAFAYGLEETYFLTKTIFGAVAGLFTGDMPLNALGGPIAIAKVASDSVKMGWQSFIFAMSWLSVNLGLLNLIPIPVLDGGQLVLLFAEGAMRRPVSEAVIENYQKIGFVMVLALIIMATYNDLGRFWTSMLKGLSGIF
jgi:regulator of sigma E protease